MRIDATYRLPAARVEIWLTGFGGQGVVLAAYIIGRACTLHAGKSATMIQSFGPEARGSSCSATLVVQDGEVLYPYVRRPNILVAMSAEGYEKFGDQLADDGLLLFERDLVHPRPLPAQRAFGISSTRIAESLGRSLIQNIVMVGFFAALAGVVPRAALRAAVHESVPSGTEELNLAAFDQGAAFADREFGTAPALASALAAASGEEARL